MTGYSIAIEAATAVAGLKRGELLKLRGPAIFLDRISGNNRKYIAESVHEQVRLLQPRIAAKSLFGELDHPPVDDLNRLAYVQMQNVSHRIDALWWDEAKQAYFIEVTVLDTPSGRILKSICDAGSPLYVSLRSLLDPAKNRQQNGYVEAWMLALITIDFVSQPGFSDAVLEPIAAANESMRAVCEALNMTSLIHNNKRMHNTNKNMYGVILANENMTGTPVEPSQSVIDLANRVVADIRSKFPNGFTEEDFNAEYAGLFDGYLLGLYSITATISLVKLDEQTTVVFGINKLANDKFDLPDDIEFEYFDAESSPSFSGANEGMYTVLEPAAVIATENWTPTESDVKLAEDVLSFMRTNYKDGFDTFDFQTVADNAKSNLGVDLSLSKQDDSYSINFTTADATIKLTASTVGNALSGDYSIAEYASNQPMSDEPGNDADKANKQSSVNQQMYQIVDMLQTEDTHKGGDAENDKPAEDVAVSDSVAEIAEEAAKIFGMPNSRFAGNFAIEHMPQAYKHCWNSLSETGKLIVAKRAEQAGIATEAQTIKFFSKIDWTGIERAVIFAGNAEAAVEAVQQIDVNKRALFLSSFVPRR